MLRDDRIRLSHMRDAAKEALYRLIHAYFDVDLDILWQTVTTELPPLITALEESLQTERE